MVRMNRKGIDTLIEEFGSADIARWRSARHEVAQLGTTALKPLVFALLYDANPTVRWRAAEALGEMGEPQSAKDLILALADEDSSVRWCSINALAELGGGAVRLLQGALSHDNEDVRWGASEALREIEARLRNEEAERFRRLMEGRDPSIEEVDDSWFWQLCEDSPAPQIMVSRNALG